MVSVPAPYVPEELISQAQVVLQGKSRNLIIRELQASFFVSRNVVLHDSGLVKNFHIQGGSNNSMRFTS